MSNNSQIIIHRPFGPTVAKMTMPPELVEKLNSYIDELIKDQKKAKELDHGAKLAGNVKQEFRLESEFVESSGFLKFLANSTRNWIKFSGLTEIKKFNVIAVG